jgi:hypothetical protein
MTCKHIQQVIKKMNSLLLELNNTDSELYQTSEPLYKKENIEIKKEIKKNFLSKTHKEKVIFDPEKATFINKVRVEELQKVMSEINKIVADCDCYNEIWKQLGEERLQKKILKQKNSNKKEKIKKQEEENKELDKAHNVSLIKNQRNIVLLEVAEKDKDELKEKKQKNKEIREKLKKADKKISEYQNQIKELQKYKLHSEEEKLEELFLDLSIEEEIEDKIKELTNAYAENYDNSIIEVLKKSLKKELLKKNIRLAKIHNIFANCKEIAELRIQLEKKQSSLEDEN